MGSDRPILAVDCDLRKVYAVDGRGKVVAKADPDGEALVHWLTANPTGRIIYEIASALDYTNDKAIAHQKRRWTIFNIAVCARVHAAHPGKVLVAPSHVWTRGHPLATRHGLAKADAAQKDLRECQAMLWFYRHEPARWVPFTEFLTQL